MGTNCVVILSYLLLSTFFTVSKSITVHEEIIQWWTKISEQKPFQCKVNFQYLQPFHPVALKISQNLTILPLITSRPCSKNDTIFLEHTFKGKIFNGKFEGPGKLKFIKKSKQEEYEEGELYNLNRTCIGG